MEILFCFVLNMNFFLFHGEDVLIKLTSLTFPSDSVLKRRRDRPEWSMIRYVLLLFDKALFVCFALPGFVVAMRDYCWTPASNKIFIVSCCCTVPHINSRLSRQLAFILLSY